MRFDLQATVAEGSKVVCIGVMTGTHDGPFHGIPATHRPPRLRLPVTRLRFLISPSGTIIWSGTTQPASTLAHRAGNSRLSGTSSRLDLMTRRVGRAIS